ncbi:MAG TPA: hypothetical protein ENK75_05830 [Saprospiraceae bacterium]|nr:hypothetical protein [Saprospiraceae bacterium]
MAGLNLSLNGGQTHFLYSRATTMDGLAFESLLIESKKNLPTGEFDLSRKPLSEVSKRIAQAINQSQNIAIYCDYDVDGIATGTMMKEFIDDVAKKIKKRPQVDINISTRYSSGYGMSADKVEELDKSHDLIIGIDHGANAEFLESYTNNNKMVIFDHHPSRNVYDFIINPATDGITGISSGMVVKKFIDYFIDRTKLEINPEKYSDLETLTIISDMAKLNDYSRRRLEVGLREINKKDRFAFQTMKGKIQHKDLSFDVISKVNAVGRMEDKIDFVSKWLQQKVDYPSWKKTTDRINNINTEKKRLINKYFNIFVEQSEAEKDSGNNLRLYVADDIPIGLNGLIAQKLFQYTNKETVVMSLHQGLYRGSGRGYNIDATLSNIKDALKRRDKDKMFFGGHSAAVGVKIKPELLDAFSFHCKNAVSQEHEEIEMICSASVTELIKLSKIYKDFTDGIPLDKKFWLSLEDYSFVDIKRHKSNYASVQLTDGESDSFFFLSLDMIKEEHLRNGLPLRIAVDELYKDDYTFKFSVEAPLVSKFEDKNKSIMHEEEVSLIRNV